MLDGKPTSVRFWDTMGREGYDRIRQKSYPKTDVFLICFSVASPESFARVSSKWWPEIRRHTQDNAFFLVGTKGDLRNNESMKEQLQVKGFDMVSAEQANDLAHEIGALSYLECSSLTHEGLNQVFDTAIRASLENRNNPKPRKKACTIL